VARPIAFALIALGACAPHVRPPPESADRDIPFAAYELYPEGVAFDPTTGGFFVGSLRHGTIGRVMRDGTYRPFTAPGPLVSTQGIAVDLVRRRVLLVGGDLGVGVRTSAETLERQAGLALYALDTGALIR